MSGSPAAQSVAAIAMTSAIMHDRSAVNIIRMGEKGDVRDYVVVDSISPLAIHHMLQGAAGLELRDLPRDVF